jgi:hypothetical protein
MHKRRAIGKPDPEEALIGIVELTQGKLRSGLRLFGRQLSGGFLVVKVRDQVLRHLQQVRDLRAFVVEHRLANAVKTVSADGQEGDKRRER